MYDLTEDQRKLKARAHELTESKLHVRAAKHDETEEYPWDTIKDLTDAGFMGMTVPKDLGGPGLGFLEVALVIEEVSRACGSTGRIVTEANMGAIAAILQFGSDEQKKICAELVLAGDKPAICMSEPDAGSAATAMTTKAVKKGDTYVINGQKHWITGGADISKVHFILARVEEDGESQGIGGFIVVHEGKTSGMRAVRRHRGMGLRCLPEMEMAFEDLEVHESMAIKPEGGWRRGFGLIIDSYNSQRVGSAAVCLGISQGALEQAVAYSKTREQFGRPIAEFQGLQWMMADMQVTVNAMRNFVYQAALSSAGTKNGFPEPMLAAQAKLYGSEMSKKVAHDALQIHGAEGYSRDRPLERYYRDTRMFSIGGGTAQILRNTVAGEVLGMRLPQTRDGYTKLAARAAAE
ncbi:MAG: acyl-CoA dehydrogenase family protein [Methyloligellaceae bacterium]